MKIGKILTIVIDLSLGSIVISIGLSMLPFPLNIVWSVFNAYIWIVSPIILWRANKKEKKCD